MRTTIITTVIAITLMFPHTSGAQTQSDYTLPKPVMIELNRLDEAYLILDQFAEKVWTGWDDYLNFPFLMTFQDGLRVLVGHPNPPEGFIPYPQLTIHDLSVCIDTSKLNNFPVHQPLQCGGGVLPYGTDKNNQPVTIVDLNLISATDDPAGKTEYLDAEYHILVFIHELMHCYQARIMPQMFGNLSLNPDLKHALYSEIEGLALQRAFEQDSPEKAIPFLKDFCVARSFKYQGMDESEINQARCDEFREGEAVYSEVTILQNIKNGFKSNLTAEMDPGYQRFKDIDRYLNKYINRLKENSGKTLEIYQKNYDYGCFEALMLQKYFPEWQKKIEAGSWLDPVLRERLEISKQDSLLSLERFRDNYQIDDLKNKHEKIINGRNETYRSFISRKGQVYVINFKPIKQYLPGLADKTKPTYKLGLMEMFPEGTGPVKFDGIVLDMKPVPTEINQLYYFKVVDTNPGKSKKNYAIEYQSQNESGTYTNVTITTPLFTLKAPKVMIRERGNRIKIIVLSRV
ncbi:MAG: hypothetical protein V2A67_11205 [Bacteroidota bacterium]